MANCVTGPVRGIAPGAALNMRRQRRLDERNGRTVLPAPQSAVIHGVIRKLPLLGTPRRGSLPLDVGRVGILPSVRETRR